MHFWVQRLVSLSAFCAAIVILLVSSGCPSSGSVEADRKSAGLGEMPDIGSRIDRVLAENLEKRRLDVTTHGAWQVLHGVLAYGDEFEVQTPAGTTSAIQYLFQGNVLDGFRPQPADRLSSDGAVTKVTGNPVSQGLRFAFEPSTKTGQGHRDQWLAVLAQAGTSLEDTLRVGQDEYPWREVVRQTEYDIPLNLEEEFSWTLIGILAYRETDHQWVARDGREYSIELLLEVELSQSMESSVCGGTHRLAAIAAAVAKRRSEINQ